MLDDVVANLVDAHVARMLIGRTRVGLGKAD